MEAFEDDGIYIFNILHSHRTQKPLAVVAGHSARATIQYRPVHGDVIQYDARLGRLRVAARTSSMVECYRRVLGLTLFKDEDFFDGNAVCSLKVLQERGREALDSHEVFGVGRIRMTECLWERGDRDLLQIRSNDCFRSIEELDLNVKEGVFIQAKLKCDVVGKSTRPVTVNIRVPSRIEISQRSQETLIERVLDAVGIRNAAPRSATVSLWALHPWRHPASKSGGCCSEQRQISSFRDRFWRPFNWSQYPIRIMSMLGGFWKRTLCRTRTFMERAGFRRFRRALSLRQTSMVLNSCPRRFDCIFVRFSVSQTGVRFGTKASCSISASSRSENIASFWFTHCGRRHLDQAIRYERARAERIQFVSFRHHRSMTPNSHK